MSEASARAMLEAMASYGDDRARQIAQDVLDKWDEVSASALRMRETRRRRTAEAESAAQRVALSDARVAPPLQPRESNANATEAQPVAERSSSALPRTPSPSQDLSGDLFSGDQRESPRASGDVAPSDATPKRLRAKHRYSETTCPDPEDATAFAGWCSTWKLDPADPVVIACATYHYGKGTLWRDWTAAVRTWRARERGSGVQRVAPALQPVAPNGRTWKVGDGQ